MKKFLAVPLAAFIAIVLAGCGTETKDVENGGYIPFSPTPTPTPQPVNPDVDLSEKVIFSSNLGSIADVCVDSTGNKIFFPLNNGIIKCYDRTTGKTSDIKTSKTNIFSVCYVDGRIYFTERATKNVCFINEDGTGETTVTSSDSSDSSKRIDDPAYIRYGGDLVVGTDFGYSTSGSLFCINPTVNPSSYVKLNITNISKPLDIDYANGTWVSANFNPTDSYVFYNSDNPSQEAAWGSVQVSGKYIASPCLDIVLGGNSSAVYSTMDNTGTSIRKVDPVTHADTALLVNGSYPYTYKIVKSEIGSKYYFTSMGNAGNAGVYMMDADGSNVTRVSESTMYYPAMVIVNENRTDLPEGYEEIIWTTTGSDIDKSTATFNGGNGHVYSKVIKVY